MTHTTHTTLTIRSDSETTLHAHGQTARITTTEDGRHYVHLGSRARDHRDTREFSSLADARRDAIALCQDAARAIARVELFEVAL
jgi:hypothetical protein